MPGKKGRSGRPRKYKSHPLIDKIRKDQLRRYYENREQVLERMRKYHKRIKDYSIEHNISFEEARKIVGDSGKRGRKRNE